MSTWAYKDGILVSDTLISTNQEVIAGNTHKIHKAKNGWLLAGAGNLRDIHRFFDWVDEGADPDAAIKLENLDGIVIKSKNDVWQIDDALYMYKIDAPFYFGGAGGSIALGAMAAGATAEEAIKIAMKYSLGTGGKVQKLTI